MKPFTFFRTAALLFPLLLSNQLFAQTELKSAWQAFFQNKNEEARALFTKASAQKESAESAYLGLSLLSQLDRPATESFSYFKKFYAISANPQPYIYALWVTPSVNENFEKKTPEQLAFFQELTQKKDYEGTINAIAYSMIGNHYNSIKQSELSKKAFASLGSIDNWAISGEFENISTSGFDKQYETLNKPEDNATFLNKHGVPVAWHAVPYLRNDKWFDFTYYANAYDDIVFAQTFVNSPQDQEVQLRTGVSGSMKVWVNDALILSEPEERNNDLDSYIQSVKLNKGYNRILVQVGESYAERSNFMARLTDKDGHLLPGITASAKYHPYTKDVNYKSQKTEHFAVAYFEQQIKAKPDDDVAKILLAETLLELDRTFEARTIIDPLLKKYPNNTFLNVLLVDLFTKTKNRTGAETVKESIKANDPESLLGLSLKYAELFEQKKYDQAADINNKIASLYPFAQETVYSNKIDLADANKNQAQLVSTAEEAYIKFPSNRNFVTYKYEIEENLKKNVPEAIKILKNYVANNNDYDKAKNLAELYFTSGNSEAGLKVYRDEIKFDSVGVGIYNGLAGQYFKQQKYDQAAKYYLDCIKIAPTIGSYYTSLGQAYDAAGQKAKAIEAYQKGLKLDPTDYESIKALRKLQNKKDVFGYMGEPDLAAMIKGAPSASEYPDNNFLVLNNEVQKVVYENGGSEDRHYVLAKILNQKGIDALKEYNVPYNNDQSLVIETAEVIKANGSKVPAEKNENSLVFTNLEIGDVINISYKLDNYFKGSLASHFWDDFYFTNAFPVINVKYSLLVPKGKKFSYKFSGTPITVAKSEADEFELYVWKGTNVKAITIEDKMPAASDVTNMLHITSLPDWKFVSDWYNDIATAKARPNYEVKSVVNELFAGKNNLTDAQKIEKIYNYITGNISYSSVSFRQSGIVPQNPADVINTRIGDCKDVSTLFVSMCKEAGIKAQLVLVKTRNYGLNSMILPSIDFNHCMAKVNANGKDYYYELTSKYLPVTSLYNTAVNSSILDIGGTDADKTIKYLDPATRKQNNVTISSEINIKDGELFITEKSNRTQAQAAIYRAAFSDMSENDKNKKFKEYLSSLYPDNNLSEISFKNLTNTQTDTVNMMLKYEVKNAIKEIAGMNIFSLPWNDKIQPSYLKISANRTNPIDLSQLFSMDNETETITLTLPSDKKMVEDPKPVVLTNDFIEYSIVPQNKNGKLVITRTIKVKKEYIPADKAQDFGAFFKKVIDADNRELAMK